MTRASCQKWFPTAAGAFVRAWFMDVRVFSFVAVHIVAQVASQFIWEQNGLL